MKWRFVARSALWSGFFWRSSAAQCFCKVEFGAPGSGAEVVAYYFFPDDGEPAAPSPAAARPDVMDIPTQASDSAVRLLDGGTPSGADQPRRLPDVQVARASSTGG